MGAGLKDRVKKLFTTLLIAEATVGAVALVIVELFPGALISIFLQAMGKALESTILSTVREIVFGVGFALLLPLKFGLDGVLYSMPLSDLLTSLIALFLIIQTYRELGMGDVKKAAVSTGSVKNFS